MILNCGRGMVGFYERSSFKVISERAVYIRDNKTVVEDDPVMVLLLKPGIPLDEKYGCVRIGEDF